MATQTGSYDFKAAKAAHDDAAKTASDYITEITDEGIKVSPNGLKNVDWSQITPNGMEIYKTAESVAKFGQETRIGSEAYSHQTLGADGYNLYQGADSVFAIEPYGPETATVIPYDSAVTVPANGNQIIPAGPMLHFSDDPTFAKAQAYCQSLIAQGRSYPYQAYIAEGTTRTRIPLNTEVEDTSAEDWWAQLNYLGSSDPTTGASAANIRIDVFNNTSSDITVVVGTAQDTRPMRVRVGRDAESHMELDYHSLQLIDKEGDTYFHVSDLRDASGNLEVEETFDVDSATLDDSTYFVLAYNSCTLVSAIRDSHYDITELVEIGWVLVDIVKTDVVRLKSGKSWPSGMNELTVTYTTDDAKNKALTFGTRNSGGGRKPGSLSVCFGKNNTATGMASVATGESCSAKGLDSFACGFNARAWGILSSAFGESAWAYGRDAHAQGCGAIAEGLYSHASGWHTRASGMASHAQNSGTIAAYDHQTALGKYNDNQSTNALEIGKGTADDARSNAFAVDWSGNVLIDGDVQDMSGNAKYANASHTHSYLPLSGGKMTGRLAFKDGTAMPNASTNTDFFAVGFQAFTNGGGVWYKGASDFKSWLAPGSLYSKNTAAGFDRDGANPSSALYGEGFIIQDKDGERVGFIRANRLTDGTMQMQLSVANDNTSGTEVTNYVTVGINRSGTRSVSFAESAPWRTALGLDDLVKVVSATTSSISIAANSNHSFAPTLTIPSGYTLVGPLGCKYTANNANLSTGAVYKYSSNQIAANVVNHSSSARSVAVTTYGLCVKSICVG